MHTLYGLGSAYARMQWILWAVNVVALRESLRLLRNQAGKTHRQIGLNKVTIYRIENTKNRPR